MGWLGVYSVNDMNWKWRNVCPVTASYRWFIISTQIDPVSPLAGSSVLFHSLLVHVKTSQPSLQVKERISQTSLPVTATVLTTARPTDWRLELCRRAGRGALTVRCKLWMKSPFYWTTKPREFMCMCVCMCNKAPMLNFLQSPDFIALSMNSLSVNCGLLDKL